MRKIVHVLLEKAVGNATSTSNNTRAKMILCVQAMREKPFLCFCNANKRHKNQSWQMCVYRLQDEIAQKILQHGFIQGIIIAG